MSRDVSDLFGGPSMRLLLLVAAVCSLGVFIAMQPVRAQVPERDVLADYRLLIGELRAQGFIGCPDEQIDPGWTFESMFFFKAHDLEVHCDRREEGRGYTHLGRDRAEIGMERVRNRVWKLRYLGLEDSRADMAANQDRVLALVRMLRPYDPQAAAIAERAVLTRRSLDLNEGRGEALHFSVSAARTPAGRGHISLSVTNLTVAPDRSALISNTGIARLLAALALIGIVIGFPYAAYLRYKMGRGDELTRAQMLRGYAAAWAAIGGLLILLLLPWGWL